MGIATGIDSGIHTILGFLGICIGNDIDTGIVTNVALGIDICIEFGIDTSNINCIGTGIGIGIDSGHSHRH